MGAEEAARLSNESKLLGDKAIPCDYLLMIEGHEYLEVLACAFPLPYSMTGKGVIQFYETVAAHAGKFLSVVSQSGVAYPAIIRGPGLEIHLSLTFGSAYAPSAWEVRDKVLTIQVEVDWKDVRWIWPESGSAAPVRH